MPRRFQKEQETEMLRAEMEILMNERQSLLSVVGAAAVFVAELDSTVLPDDVCEDAKLLSNALNNLPEETLRDALEKVRAELAVSE